MTLIFGHEFNPKCTTIKAAKGKINLVDYLKEADKNIDKSLYHTKEIGSNIDFYLAGEGAKRITIVRTVMDYHSDFNGNKSLPKFNERKIYEKYVVTSKTGKRFDSFYFRRVYLGKE